jgi:chemotaxis protein methyltransferase CheR
MMQEIDILGIKNIISLVKQKYGFDPGILASFSLKYKLQKILENYDLQGPELLIKRLENEPDFYHTFLYSLFSSSSELFRDPEMWIHLKDKIIPELISTFENIKLLVGFTTCGCDLYSSLILMNELNLDRKVSISFSWPAKENKNRILDGFMNNHQLETSLENLRKVLPDIDESKYLIRKDKYYHFNPKFLKNLSDSQFDFHHKTNVNNYNLIICRNRLINFNSTYQNLMLDNLVKSLEKNGILVLGYKENIRDYAEKSSCLEPEYEEEKIYKRILNG